eukprot:8233079-Alexandrium_andersonii.AAC.1
MGAKRCSAYLTSQRWALATRQLRQVVVTVVIAGPTFIQSVVVSHGHIDAQRRSAPLSQPELGPCKAA